MSRSTLANCASAIAVGLFAALVDAHGVPILRHDWHWPTDRASAFDWLVTATSGWRMDGIGNANAFPTEYFYGAFSAIVALAAGPVVSLFLALAGIGAIAATGARALCKRAQADIIFAPISTFVLLFNPWVYTEIVAGHLFMIPAAFGFLFLIAALLPGSRPSLLLLLGAIFVSAQLQFAILALPLIAYGTWRTRSPLAIVAWSVLILPLIVGIAANLHEVSQTPFLPTWEFSQSVSFLHALRLTGYFAGYDRDMYAIAKFGVWVLLALAAYCTIMSRQPIAVASATVILLIAALASGPQTFAAPAFNWAITHLPFLGIFRELYDEIGIAAVLYCCCVLLSAQSVSRYSLVAMATAAALMTVGFAIHPPWQFFVANTTSTHSIIRIVQNQRFATIPAFQPLTTPTGGSGVDPAAISYVGNRTSLNEYIPKYPANAAIMRYVTNGDPTWLAALSVGEVDFRCNLFSLRAPLNPFTIDQRVSCPSHVEYIHAQPEAMTLSLPITPIATDITKPAIFTGDIDATVGFESLAPSASLDAKHGWVAASFTALEEPAAAEAWGGVSTFATTPYSVSRGRMLFAYVKGALFSGKRQIAQNTGSFLWVAIDPPAELHCHGFCELVGTGNRVGMASGPPASQQTAVPFSRILPWFVRATPTDPTSSSFLWRERFNYWWLAIQSGHLLAHVPVNGVFNGWRETDGAHPIYLIESVAAVQAVLEATAYAVIALLLLVALRRPEL